ncbi:MopE-related protein [Polyangium aurulentum]|uniref:MopE-related protein n=1 Tax=Polyangium aurulentum TaxID=2567896 RepID=UPI0010AE016B|nr:MopE-related protein [Polyangium aurulentum]UQA55284.1 hypothetical protein E8A73_028520 [Polyangium aurulentum]
MLHRMILRAAGLSSLAALVALTTPSCGPASEDPCAPGAPALLSCGVGECRAQVEACPGGEPAECVPGTPAAEEFCDGMDNDCDGNVDEDCSCAVGEEQRCYTGALSTRRIGMCRDGFQQCVTGIWTDCFHSVEPDVEVCNGLDDDCDGDVDEDCPCEDGDQKLCFGSRPEERFVAPCQEGTQVCEGGVWGKCTGDVTPAMEQCDLIDNDCDGGTDNIPACGCVGDTLGCYTGPPETMWVGPCQPGFQVCSFGKLGPCQNEVIPHPELCNGIDDDCDGTVDDEAQEGGPCETNMLGACAEGKVQCKLAEPKCIPVNVALPEICNGIDDDCDGDLDEGSFCCPDAELNGDESDVDCGGSCMNKCGTGRACLVSADCASGVCTADVCQ